MKTLYLIRHAKSSWEESGLTDFERHLNKRGKRDAPFMAKLLHKLEINPDLIISSPAVRALTTAKIFSEELNYPVDKIQTEPMLYEAGRKEFLEIIKNINDKHKTVFLFAHNPGLTNFSNYLSDKEIDNIPTCGIVTLKPEKNTWNEIEENGCKLVSFDYPKKYLKV